VLLLLFVREQAKSRVLARQRRQPTARKTMTSPTPGPSTT
jgi:hypothetical protein